MISVRMLIVTAMAAGLAGTSTAAPIDHGVDAPTPDVFYNFYLPPSPPPPGYPGVGAQLYVSPRPVPPRVGHTWITYPPFMPHEFLHKHERRYIRPAGAMGFKTDARVWWY